MKVLFESCDPPDNYGETIKCLTFIRNTFIVCCVVKCDSHSYKEVYYVGS